MDKHSTKQDLKNKQENNFLILFRMSDGSNNDFSGDEKIESGNEKLVGNMGQQRTLKCRAS